MAMENDRRVPQEETGEIKKSPLADFEGRYIGFSPSDESNAGYGEMEIIIDDKAVKLKIDRA
jgi:hypothetical protein